MKRLISSKIFLSLLIILFLISITALFIPRTYANIIVDTQDIILEYGEYYQLKKDSFFNSESIDIKLNLAKTTKDELAEQVILNTENLIFNDNNYLEVGEYIIELSSQTDNKTKIKLNGEKIENIKIIVQDTTPPMFTQSIDEIETYKDVTLIVEDYFIAEDLSDVTIIADNSNIDFTTPGEYLTLVHAEDIYANKTTKSVRIIVKQPTIKLNKTSISLYKNKGFQLDVTIEGKDDIATYKSSNSNVAIVDKNGYIKAKSNGTATITATANGVSAECKVTVKELTTIFKIDGNVENEYIIKANNELKYLPSNVYNRLVSNGWNYYIVGYSMMGEDYYANFSGKIYAITFWDGSQKVYIDKTKVTTSLIHEMGHVLDCSLGRISAGEFNNIYLEEKDNYVGNIPESKSHHISEAREFFADSFKAYLKWPSKLKAACPKTYEYMKKFVAGL